MPTTLWDVIAVIWRTTPFAFVGIAALVALVLIGTHQQAYSLNGIKTKPVGDGQHGTARWATPEEINEAYHKKRESAITAYTKVSSIIQAIQEWRESS